jgi:hypothetical protein
MYIRKAGKLIVVDLDQLVDPSDVSSILSHILDWVLAPSNKNVGWQRGGRFSE